MKKKDIENQIKTILARNEDVPLTAKEIRSALGAGKGGVKKLHSVLAGLVREGEIVQIRNNRYSLGRPADLITGELDVARSGNGFLTGTDSGGDIFIPSRDMGVALPGDRVLVRLQTQGAAGKGAGKRGGKRRGKGSETGRRQPVLDDELPAGAKPVRPASARGEAPSGKVIRVLERSRRDIVGTLRSTGRFFYVVPLDPVYTQDFLVATPGKAQVDDRVVVRFVEWQNRHVSPEAEIIEVLGRADNPSLDTISVIRHYRIRETFPESAMREAESASGLMDETADRLDLRKKRVLTIDPASARDFDDALSLEELPDGTRLLGVHIADVSHFVVPGSALDEEARKRGNSVYLADKVIPMLPEQLSNGVCSLKPDEDRLTFSALLKIGPSGRVESQEFTKSIIRSGARLTYEQALKALQSSADGNASPRKMADETLDLLQRLNDLAQQFRARRLAASALELDIPECEVVIDRGGNVEDIKLVKSDISHQLIEECMILANEAVARELSNRRYSLIYRIHEPPAPAKIVDLETELISLGYEPGDLSKRRNLAAFLRKTQDDPLNFNIKVAVLRSMNRAIYSSSPVGHFGLGKKFYTHFTSPIRRYPDLVVHRQLARIASRRGGDDGQRGRRYRKDELERIASLCSRTEQTADTAERAVEEIKKYRFLERQMKGNKQEVYNAVVVRVVNFGCFVEVLNLQVQGLVHVSAMSDRFVRFSGKERALRVGKKVYKIGTPMKVYVNKVDFDKRQLDFAIA